MEGKQNYKAIKKGLGTTYKRQEIPVSYESMTVRDRILRHMQNHPNDTNRKNPEKGVQWVKKNARKTQREKNLEDFYNTHVYTWVSENNRAWVAIPMGEEE